MEKFVPSHPSSLAVIEYIITRVYNNIKGGLFLYYTLDNK